MGLYCTHEKVGQYPQIPDRSIYAYRWMPSAYPDIRRIQYVAPIKIVVVK